MVDLFVEGYLDAVKKLPMWCRFLPLLAWLLVYLALMGVVAWLAYSYESLVLYLFDAGFLLIVLGVGVACLDYAVRHKKTKRK